jgi:hypothetical protein
MILNALPYPAPLLRVSSHGQGTTTGLLLNELLVDNFVAVVGAKAHNGTLLRAKPMSCFLVLTQG